MNCMRCGAVLTESAYCPKCGCDVIVQKQAIVLSGLYYNQGLEKAEIRDLSGAIGQLKRSLKFNKMNVPARNLLGLVYFETGEVVAALSEWVISKNIQPDHNIAEYYISALQKDSNKLDTINQTIKKYNIALANCREHNEDVAMIQLKKILMQNPKLIKGYHLLALLHIRKEEFEKARKVLKKAVKIDRTNTTTLRFLREIEEQTGLMTKLDPRGRKEKNVADKQFVQSGNNDPVIQTQTFKETSIGVTLFNIALGLLIGAATVWFLAVPAMKQSVNRDASEKVTSYSETMATQAADIKRLQSQTEQMQSTVDTANQQIEEANEKSTTYENLLIAINAYNSDNYTTASNALTNVNSDLLSVDAKSTYDAIFANVKTTMYNKFTEDGYSAFDDEDYATAIQDLTQAYAIQQDEYKLLNYLAHSYRLTGDTANADKYFQEIITKFPDTKRARSAASYLSTAANNAEDTGGTTDNGTTDAEE